MSDTKHSKTSQKKAVPNSLRLKFANNNSLNGSVNQKNMASILNRLPFLHQLKEAQNSLLKISPVWLNWCSIQQQNNNNSDKSFRLASNAELRSINNGELLIACNSPITASLIKHQQSSLIDTFHSAGLEKVQKIKTQVILNTGEDSNKQTNSDASETLFAKVKPQTNAQKKVNSDAIKSIKATQSHTKNEQLVASLQRLADTLKNSN